MASRALDVLLVAQPSTYGVAVCVSQLAGAGVAAGHEVTVACPPGDRGPLARWVRDAGARHVAIEFTRRPRPRDVTDALSLRRLARGRDVVHLHSSKAAALGRIAAASLGRGRPAVIVTPHSWSWQLGGAWAPVYRTIERALAPTAGAIVAVSEREAAEGRATFRRTASSRMRVIPNGVDRRRYHPDGPVADRDPSYPLVVCVGRLSQQKGQDVALDALALLADRRTRLRFVGASENGELEPLQEHAERLEVAERVEWVGHVADAGPHMRAADVVVAPSRWDGMSLVLLEAMACGATVVATRVAGSEALAGAGVVVPPGDAAALACEIDALLADPARRRDLGRAARTRSAAFDLKVTLERNLELWRELADRRRGSGPRTGKASWVTPARGAQPVG